MTGPWVGVDPGSSFTGIVVRHGNRLLWHRIVQRDGDEDVVRGVGVGPAYLGAVLGGIGLALAHVITHGSDEVVAAFLDTAPQVAVEGVVRPTGFKDGRRVPLTDPSPAIGTGMVLGAVLGQYPGAVVVPPNHHGEGLLATYPHELVTPAEMRRGLHRKAGHSASVNHARSAWDLAGQGPIHAALRSARRPTTGANA